jgi:hypothetical protein
MASISVVVPEFLFIGNAKAAKDQSLLQKVSITHVVNLAGKVWFPGQFIYKECKIADAEDVDLEPILADVFAFIDAASEKKKGRIFVHCLAGVSRSAAIVLGYLMHRFNLALWHSFVYLKFRRDSIRPNHGFLQCLSKLEIKLFGRQLTSDEILQNLTITFRTVWRHDSNLCPQMFCLNLRTSNPFAQIRAPPRADSLSQVKCNGDSAESR